MIQLTITWQRLLDNNGKTCHRCSLTEKEVEGAVQKLKESLAYFDIDVVLKKSALSLDDFRKAPLQSNRIWINEKRVEEWIGAETGQSRCCDVCGDAECRTITVEGQTYEAVPESVIIKAGLIAASHILPVATSHKPLRILLHFKK